MFIVSRLECSWSFKPYLLELYIPLCYKVHNCFICCKVFCHIAFFSTFAQFDAPSFFNRKKLFPSLKMKPWEGTPTKSSFKVYPRPLGHLATRSCRDLLLQRLIKVHCLHCYNACESTYLCFDVKVQLARLYCFKNGPLFLI